MTRHSSQRERRAAPAGATWLTAWALALAIAGTLLLARSLAAQQATAEVLVGCAASAPCSR